MWHNPLAHIGTTVILCCFLLLLVVGGSLRTNARTVLDSSEPPSLSLFVWLWKASNRYVVLRSSMEQPEKEEQQGGLLEQTQRNEPFSFYDRDKVAPFQSIATTSTRRFGGGEQSRRDARTAGEFTSQNEQEEQQDTIPPELAKQLEALNKQQAELEQQAEEFRKQAEELRIQAEQQRAELQQRAKELEKQLAALQQQTTPPMNNSSTPQDTTSPAKWFASGVLTGILLVFTGYGVVFFFFFFRKQHGSKLPLPGFVELSTTTTTLENSFA